jgi:hypothetical protein
MLVFLVHPSIVDVGSVSIVCISRAVLKLLVVLRYRWYPPLRTVSPGKHVAVELAMLEDIVDGNGE